MLDFPYSCEIVVRKIFQCERFEDPLGILSNADNWAFIDEEYDIDFKFKSWAVISRLKSEYLDSVQGREELYEQAEKIEEIIINAEVNSELKNAMLGIEDIVDKLNLSEFPRIDYSQTNDVNK